VENAGLFEILQTCLSKFYNPSELEVDKVIVKFKGSVFFIQYIPKKMQTFRRQHDAAMWRVFSEGREAKSELKVCQTLLPCLWTEAASRIIIQRATS
jgi:hypothetical protein